VCRILRDRVSKTIRHLVRSHGSLRAPTVVDKQREACSSNSLYTYRSLSEGTRGKHCAGRFTRRHILQFTACCVFIISRWRSQLYGAFSPGKVLPSLRLFLTFPGFSETVLYFKVQSCKKHLFMSSLYWRK